ncbi:hypothetical protein CUT44_03605 [Streptomyces carminius]|uniref:Uncharacterized protein n=1 Tax=Streptomyces carminius TaxID=2665496 RepID=A0A2M8M5W9_9ACTN|nr:hypothetical protein CUT44_03605 [Streptomyces carminius]
MKVTWVLLLVYGWPRPARCSVLSTGLHRPSPVSGAGAGVPLTPPPKRGERVWPGHGARFRRESAGTGGAMRTNRITDVSTPLTCTGTRREKDHG